MAGHYFSFSGVCFQADAAKEVTQTLDRILQPNWVCGRSHAIIGIKQSIEQIVLVRN
jgi:hypothetical protein